MEVAKKHTHRKKIKKIIKEKKNNFCWQIHRIFIYPLASGHAEKEKRIFRKLANEFITRNSQLIY